MISIELMQKDIVCIKQSISVLVQVEQNICNALQINDEKCLQNQLIAIPHFNYIFPLSYQLMLRYFKLLVSGTLAISIF